MGVCVRLFVLACVCVRARVCVCAIHRLRFDKYFYISILEDFSHADEQVGGWIGQDEQAGQRPMHAEPHAAVMPRPLLTQPQPSKEKCWRLRGARPCGGAEGQHHADDAIVRVDVQYGGVEKNKNNKCEISVEFIVSKEFKDVFMLQKCLCFLMGDNLCAVDS